MRNFSIAMLGASALALSGCSFFDGYGSHNKTYNHHQQNSHGGGHYKTPSAADCCVGGKALSRWNLEGAIGPEFNIGGDAFTGSSANRLNAGQTFKDVDFKDAYETGYRAELGGSYALTPNRKLTAMVNYANVGANETIIGTQGANNILGKLSTYESVGVEAGLRQYFQPRVVSQNFGYRPYVEGRLGATNVDDIELTTRQDGVAGSAQTVDFYDGGWVPTAAALVGVEAPVFNRATIGVETGIRYAGKLESADDLLNQNDNFAGTNNGSDRWSIPLTLRGRYRF